MTELPTLVLSKPIEQTVKTKDGTEVQVLSEIQLKREPNAGDFWDFDPTKLTVGSMLGIFAVCSGTPTSIIKKLCYADMMEAQNIMMGFLSTSQET